jgi:hypothetical protein
MIETDISLVNISPAAFESTVGADILPTLIFKVVEAASLLNTPTTMLSMPFKFPWLSSIGTIITILKFTFGATLE